MPAAPVAIDADRLLADLHTLRSFGADGTGVRRQALSPADVAAREWLAERFTAAGLQASIDVFGTVHGRSPNPGPAILIGSHSDTQPLGGWLDGAYGVICALEVARALPGLAVDVVSWQDEEGTFDGFVGSRAFTGHDMTADLAQMEAGSRAAGWWGRPILRAEPGRYRACIEPHIEQGGRLEAGGQRLGVVTAIVGIHQHRVVFHGRRNHAGTTPMDLRDDAAMAMIRFVHDLDARFGTAAGPDSVWTVGRIDVEPGAASIIPDRADITVQYRDPDEAVLARMDEAFHAAVTAAPKRPDVAAMVYDVQPAQMDAAVQEALADACEAACPGGWRRMHSGAAHDAQLLAGLMPTGMLFVPSIGGVSHAADEDTAVADLALGCQAVATAVAGLLAGPV